MLTSTSSAFRSMARPGAVAVADQSVASLANFLTGVILARALLPEGFGFYMLGLSIILLMLDLQTTITTTPYMVYRPRLIGRERARYLGSTMVEQIALSTLLIVVLATAWVALRSGDGDAGIVSVLIALVVSLGFILFRDFVRRVCFAHLKPATALLVDSSVTLLQLGGLILLAWLGEITVFRAFLILGGAAGAVSLGWLIANRRAIEVDTRDVKADIRKNLSFGKWPLMSGIVWSASMQIYPWLLVAFHGSASAGIWAAGLGVMALGNPLLLGLQNYLGPRIATDYAQQGLAGLRGSVRHGAIIFAALMGPLAAVIAVAGGLIATLIYGQAYSGNGTLIALLILSLFVSSIAFSFSRGLFALERADIDFKVNLVAFALMLTVGIWLAYTFGVVGAAWGALLTNTVATVLRVRAFDVLTTPVRG